MDGFYGVPFVEIGAVGFGSVGRFGPPTGSGRAGCGAATAGFAGTAVAVGSAVVRGAAHGLG